MAHAHSACDREIAGHIKRFYSLSFRKTILPTSGLLSPHVTSAHRRCVPVEEPSRVLQPFPGSRRKNRQPAVSRGPPQAAAPVSAAAGNDRLRAGPGRRDSAAGDAGSAAPRPPRLGARGRQPQKGGRPAAGPAAGGRSARPSFSGVLSPQRNRPPGSPDSPRAPPTPACSPARRSVPAPSAPFRGQHVDPDGGGAGGGGVGGGGGRGRSRAVSGAGGPCAPPSSSPRLLRNVGPAGGATRMRHSTALKLGDPPLRSPERDGQHTPARAPTGRAATHARLRAGIVAHARPQGG